MAEIFILQLLFQLSRTLGNRFISRDHVVATVVMTTLIQALWLITTALGVKAVFATDYYIIGGYMFGGILGSIIAMKLKIKG